MKRRNALIVAMAAGMAMALGRGAVAAPVTTAFTFQGELKNSGNLASGPVDLRFRVYDAVSAGTQIGGQASASNVSLASGRFTLQLDFGVNIFQGDRRFVEIDVADAGSGIFTTLAPRVEITASPYAQHALAASSAANATSLNGQAASFYTNAANLSSGTLPSGRLLGTYTGAISFANSTNSYFGIGANLINLNASSLALGTVPDARLSTNVATLAGAQTFTGAKTFGATTVFNAPVGVGIAAPAADLDVRNASGVRARVMSDLNGGSATLDLFENVSGGAGGQIVYDGATNDLILGSVTSSVAARTDALRIARGSSNVNIVGSLGIGIEAPQDLLHVFAGSSGTTTPNTAARAIIQDDANAYLNFLTPVANENGILFGIEGNSASGGIIYNNPAAPEGLQFRTGGNFTRMTLTEAGLLGIGTAAPTAALTVSSTALEAARFTAGSNGSITVNSTGDVSYDLAASGVRKWRIMNDIGGSGGHALTILNEANVARFLLTQGGAINQLNGNLTVSGTLTATIKNFKIDHPLDPENKFLQHTCVESDEMANLYTGNITTDDLGYATITLPSWFEALNTDFRYQLTVIDEGADEFVFAKVSRKIANGEFEVKTSRGNTEVSWMVVGVRHDAAARATPTVVEVEKIGAEKGRYISPVAHGKPESLSIIGASITPRPEATPAANDAPNASN